MTERRCKSSSCTFVKTLVPLVTIRPLVTHLVTAWSCWLQAKLHTWVTLLAIRSWRLVILEVDIFASSTGELNIIDTPGVLLVNVRSYVNVCYYLTFSII